MKFDELKETCEVYEEPAEIDVPIPAVTAYTQSPPWYAQQKARPAPYENTRGPVKCKGCDYWPARPTWLETDGYCKLCHERGRNKYRENAVVAFGQKFETCMHCGGEFCCLQPSGYCSQCTVVINEMGLEQAAGLKAAPVTPEKATTITVPLDTGKYGPYYCYRCQRPTSREIGRRCPDCETNGAGPLLFFLCMGCYKRKSTVMGGRCTDCIKQIVEKNKGVDPSKPRLVKYTPTREGGWIEQVIPLAECTKQTVPTASDAHLGAYEEC